MSNRNRSGALVPAVLALVLVSALAIAADDPRNPLDGPPAARAASGETLYQVRCWQYGRLLFEERDLTLPPEVAGGLKLRGTDRNRQPVYVADTGSATCLIRSTAARR
ncbi:hypothetical protein [Piscinibacter sp. XHJ-5]|uniref:hypothetical protein n=1 Tax=Piscinibacter sp. XHJ-5 TaxID=3037797 RepID=UPI00245315AF|nr:hypothetical protein [Piscinibacter sp. XHJ-5]